jgi:pilus assembly protein CpaF
VPARVPAPPPIRPVGPQLTQLGTGAPPAPGAPLGAGGSTSPPGDVATASPGAVGPSMTAPAPPALVGSPMGAGAVPPPPPMPAALGALPGGSGPASAAPPGPVPSAVPPPNAAAFPPVPPSAQRRTPSSEDRPATADAAKIALRRQLVASLVERAAAGVDLGPIERGEPAPPALAGSIDRALRDAAGAVAAGASPAELEQAIGDARRELLELGPLGPLLGDEDVTEIQIVRHDHVIASANRRTITSELAFSSEASLARVLARLCARSGRPLDAGEVFVDRRLDGLRLFAVVPRQAGAGTMITLRRPQRADQTLDDLVRSGAVSRVVASFLGQAITARANVLVTGAYGSGATTLLGALAAAGGTDDRVVVLQEDDELVFNQPHTVSILLGDTAEEGARAVRAALRAHPDRLVLGAFAGHVVVEVLDAVGDGAPGVMAAARAPTLRHLAARLPADVAATRGGIPLDVAREWLASSFDLVVEVAKLRDGRMRVLRVGELVHEGGQLVVKDVFSFVVDRIAAGGAVEGSFVATGHVPRLAEDLAQRGAPVDPALFKPTSKGGAR